MAQSLTLTYGCDRVTPQAVSYSAGQRVSYSEAYGASNDQAFLMNIDVSQMKALYLHTDTATTLETNSSSAPDKTITMVANQPLVWSSTNGQTNPLGTTDVTALYVSAASAGTLTFEYLIDPTV